METLSGGFQQVGQRFKACRLALNLTQEECARKAGVSRQHLNRFEATGQTQTRTLFHLLSVIGQENQWDNLLSGDPAPVPKSIKEFYRTSSPRLRLRASKPRAA